MSETQESKVTKKRIRRSPEMIAQLILEAERRGNTAEICRRENIQPTQFYAWKRKFKEGGVTALEVMKRGPKKKDIEKIQLEAVDKKLKVRLESVWPIQHGLLHLWKAYPAALQ